MPPLPYPGARAVRFDDAVALDCSVRLDHLADRLDAVARTEWDRTTACTAEWRGLSRNWFDRINHETLGQLTRAASSVRDAAEALRRNIAVAAARQVELNDQARRATEMADARLTLLAADAGAAAGAGQP